MQELIRQHNAITEARYEMSALEKNIFYMLLAALNQEVISQRRYYYRISLKELNKRLGSETTVKELMDASQKLLSRVYTIMEKDGGELHTSLISSVSNMPDDAIEVGVSSMILPYLIALREYTEFDLDTALSLKSTYSKRIYEMLSQHLEAGEIYMSVEDLKWRLALSDTKTGADKYPNWANFRKVVLEKSQQELSQKSNLHFSYEAIKTGKKYTHLKFRIAKNAKSNLRTASV